MSNVHAFPKPPVCSFWLADIPNPNNVTNGAKQRRCNLGVTFRESLGDLTVAEVLKALVLRSGPLAYKICLRHKKVYNCKDGLSEIVLLFGNGHQVLVLLGPGRAVPDDLVGVGIPCLSVLAVHKKYEIPVGVPKPGEYTYDVFRATDEEEMLKTGAMLAADNFMADHAISDRPRLTERDAEYAIVTTTEPLYFVDKPPAAKTTILRLVGNKQKEFQFLRVGGEFIDGQESPPCDIALPFEVSHEGMEAFASAARAAEGEEEDGQQECSDEEVEQQQGSGEEEEESDQDSQGQEAADSEPEEDAEDGSKDGSETELDDEEEVRKPTAKDPSANVDPDDDGIAREDSSAEKPAAAVVAAATTKKKSTSTKKISVAAPAAKKNQPPPPQAAGKKTLSPPPPQGVPKKPPPPLPPKGVPPHPPGKKPPPAAASAKKPPPPPLPKGVPPRPPGKKPPPAAASAKKPPPQEATAKANSAEGLDAEDALAARWSLPPGIKDRMAKVREYKEIYGDYQVPTKYHLGSWLCKLRSMYRRGKLPDGPAKSFLDSIGFDPAVGERKKQEPNNEEPKPSETEAQVVTPVKKQMPAEAEAQQVAESDKKPKAKEGLHVETGPAKKKKKRKKTKDMEDGKQRKRYLGSLDEN